jgi:hypothetical protein
MDRKYFNELARILAANGIQSALLREDNLTILLDGHPACHVGATSQMHIAPGDVRTPEANELYHQTAPIAEMVREYMTAMDKSPPLKAIALDEDFQLLAEFNGAVLAGRETEFGYMFATWRRDYNGAGVFSGEYFLDGYEAAKQDFAIRAGLVEKQRLFSDNQLLDIYRSVSAALDDGYDLTQAEEKNFSSIQKQIKSLFPDINEQIVPLQQRVPEPMLEQSM